VPLVERRCGHRAAGGRLLLVARCDTLPMTSADGGLRRCASCKRALVESADADGADDPRIDCGGDCLWCVYDAEEGVPPDYRATRPRGWPTDREVADVVQAEVLASGRLREIEARAAIGPLVLLRDATRAGRRGWVFFWDSSAHQKSGLFSDALGGNSPIVVLRDGRVETFGTSAQALAQAECAIA
jgi:hypothetical protein